MYNYSNYLLLLIEYKPFTYLLGINISVLDVKTASLKNDHKKWNIWKIISKDACHKALIESPPNLRELSLQTVDSVII